MSSKIPPTTRFCKHSRGIFVAEQLLSWRLSILCPIPEIWYDRNCIHLA